MFLAITREYSAEQRRAIAKRTALATWLVLSIFAITGGLIFRAFGISLGAFKIAGGLMLLLMAIDMMRAQPSRTRTTVEDQAESRDRDDVAVFPLAIPMLAGPGAIATVMVLMSRAAWGSGAPPSVFVAITVTCIAAWLLMSSATMSSASSPDPVARVRTRDGPVARGGCRRVHRRWRTRHDPDRGDPGDLTCDCRHRRRVGRCCRTSLTSGHTRSLRGSACRYRRCRRSARNGLRDTRCPARSCRSGLGRTCMARRPRRFQTARNRCDRAPPYLETTCTSFRGRIRSERARYILGLVQAHRCRIGRERRDLGLRIRPTTR